jgi:Carboxypeptidase regulatory-like domain
MSIRSQPGDFCMQQFSKYDENVQKIRDIFMICWLVFLFIVIFSASSNAQTASLNGKVFMQDLSLAPGVNVFLVRASNDSTMYSYPVAASGTFHFTNVFNDYYHILIKSSTYPDQWYSTRGNTSFPEFSQWVGATDSVTIVLTGSPLNNIPNAFFSVFLYDSTNSPITIPTALVNLINVETKTSVNMRWDMNSNKYTASSLYPGNYQLQIYAPPYPGQYYNVSGNTAMPVYSKIVNSSDTISLNVNLTLRPSGNAFITGKCISDSGFAINDLTVSLYRTFDTISPLYTIQTDLIGQFSFNNIISQNYYLKLGNAQIPQQWYLLSKKYTALYPEDPIYPSFSQLDTLFITAKKSPVNNAPDSRIVIKLVDQSLTPVKSIGQVMITENTSRKNYFLPYDSTGSSYSISGLQSGNYSIKIIHPDYPGQFYNPSGNTQFENYFQPISLHDTVYLSIKPVSAFSDSSIVTTYGFISGIIHDSTGMPMRFAMVKVYNPDGIETASTTTDSSGKFDSIRVMAPYNYNLYIPSFNNYAAQYFSLSGNSLTSGSATQFTVVPGSVYYCDVTLKKFPTVDTTTINTIITASVTGRDGSFLKNAIVSLFPSSSVNATFNPRSNYAPYVSRTDSLGKTLFNNISTGEYVAYAWIDSVNYIGQFFNNTDFPGAAQKFIAGTSTTSLTFTLRKGGILSGRILSTSGQPVSNVRINASMIGNNIWFDTQSDNNGNYSIISMLSGNYMISFSHPFFIPSATQINSTYSVSEGSTTTIPDIVMTGGSRLSGNFTSETSIRDTSSGLYPSMRGTIKLYSETAADTSQNIKWPFFTSGVNFNQTDSSGINGTFKTDLLQSGTFTAFFTPEPISWKTTTNLKPILQTQGWQFLSSPSGTVPQVLSVAAADSISNLSLKLRKGFSVFGKLKNANNTDFTSGNYNIGVMVKFNNRYYVVSNTYRIQNGYFEIPGLIDGEEYFFQINANGYPLQYWNGVDSNTAYLNKGWTFHASSASLLDIVLSNKPTGQITIQPKDPFTCWTEYTASGEFYVKWSISDTLKGDTFTLYSIDNLQNLKNHGSIPRSTTTSIYQLRDPGALTGSQRSYCVIVKTGTSMVRSALSFFNPSSINQKLWIDVSSGKYGISIQTGATDSLNLTQADTLYIYKRLSGGIWKLIRKNTMYNGWFTDNEWSNADSLKTFEYKVQCPSRGINSIVKSFTLDSYFFSNLSRSLTVGPYEKYTTIQSAINAAQNYDHIQVKSGIYKENISLNGKMLNLYGDWSYGTPPVLDANGGIAITIPYYQSYINGGTVYISGFKIQNASAAIQCNDAVNLSNCLTVNCKTVLSAATDTSKISKAFTVNPFTNTNFYFGSNKCTFIAKNQGDLLFDLSNVSQLPQQNANIFWPVKTTTINSTTDNCIVAYYYSRGAASSLPLKISGTANVNFKNNDFFESLSSSTFSSVIVSNSLVIDPQFIDTTDYFIPLQSTLRTSLNGTVGYDEWRLNRTSPTVEIKAVKNLIKKQLGMKSIYLSWDPSTDQSVRFYKIFRMPAETSQFFINQYSMWEPKFSKDTSLSQMRSFTTTNTYLIDSTIEPGIPFIYVVAAVDSLNNESPIELSAAQPISYYSINNYQYSMKFSANKWYMTGLWGLSSKILSTSENRAIFYWDDKKENDKLYSQYVQTSSLFPGKGYWFKSLNDTMISIDTTNIALLSSQQDTLTFPIIKGNTGWNLISSKLPVTVTPSWLSKIPAWEWDPDSMGYKRAVSINPWQAYWINTTKDTVLPVFDNTISLAKKADITSWELQLSLTGAEIWDKDNYLGVLTPHLSKTNSSVKEMEPPQAFGSTSLYFISPNTSEKLSSYYQAASQTQSKYEWTVAISPADKKSDITVKGIASAPENVFYYWIDNNRIIDLRQSITIAIDPHTATIFGYIIATTNPHDISLYKNTFSVNSPFPNPFRSSTTIDYVIPYTWDNFGLRRITNQLVTITLYDLLGRNAGVLFKQYVPVGKNRFTWYGKNKNSAIIKPGFYVMKLECGNYVSLVKIYKVR